MSTLTDDDLIHLLDEAASSYDIPEHGPDEVIAALADEPVRFPIHRRRWVQLSAAAAVATVAVIAVGARSVGPATSTKMTTAFRGEAAPAAGGADEFKRDLDQTQSTAGGSF